MPCYFDVRAQLDYLLQYKLDYLYNNCHFLQRRLPDTYANWDCSRTSSRNHHEAPIWDCSRTSSRNYHETDNDNLYNSKCTEPAGAKV